MSYLYKNHSSEFIIEPSKYSKYYCLIIDKALNEQRTKLKKDHLDYVYYENHHILPASLFPEFKSLKDNSWNSVLLTAREHFIIHALIWKHYKSLNHPWMYKMGRAFNSLQWYKSGTRFIQINSKLYNLFKIKIKVSPESTRKHLENTDRVAAELKRTNTVIKKHGSLSEAQKLISYKRINTLMLVDDDGTSGFQKSGNKISIKLKGRVPCKDIRNNDIKLVTQEEYDNTWYLLGRTAKFIKLYAYCDKFYYNFEYLKEQGYASEHMRYVSNDKKPYKLIKIPIEELISNFDYYSSRIVINS